MERENSYQFRAERTCDVYGVVKALITITGVSKSDAKDKFRKNFHHSWAWKEINTLGEVAK